jgi:hypothetical protein
VGETPSSGGGFVVTCFVIEEAILMIISHLSAIFGSLRHHRSSAKLVDVCLRCGMIATLAAMLSCTFGCEERGAREVTQEWRNARLDELPEWKKMVAQLNERLYSASPTREATTTELEQIKAFVGQFRNAVETEDWGVVRELCCNERVFQGLTYSHRYPTSPEAEFAAFRRGLVDSIFPNEQRWHIDTLTGFALGFMPPTEEYSHRYPVLRLSGERSTLVYVRAPHARFAMELDYDTEYFVIPGYWRKRATFGASPASGEAPRN